jgi:hypothetical protein
MQMAAIIIPTPLVISKYFNASIVLLPYALALLLRLYRYRVPHKDHPNHLPENKFFRQQRHRHGKNKSGHHRNECDRYLHNAPLSQGQSLARFSVISAAVLGQTPR